MVQTSPIKSFWFEPLTPLEILYSTKLIKMVAPPPLSQILGAFKLALPVMVMDHTY